MPMPMASNVERTTTGGRVALEWGWQAFALVAGVDAQRSDHRRRNAMGRDAWRAQPWTDDAGFRQQAQLARNQRLAIALQQAFGLMAKSASRAGCHGDGSYLFVTYFGIGRHGQLPPDSSSRDNRGAAHYASCSGSRQTASDVSKPCWSFT